jgi:AcrR family transcriptional regulator
MPRLAQRLDVGVTSIYWYFRSKDDLLDMMTERAMAELDGNFDLSQDLPCDDYVRTYFRQFREVPRGNGLLCAI